MAIVKSNKDTRYGLDSIVTHDGVKLPCWALPDLSSFRQKIGLDAYDEVLLMPQFDDAMCNEVFYFLVLKHKIVSLICMKTY